MVAVLWDMDGLLVDSIRCALDVSPGKPCPGA